MKRFLLIIILALFLIPHETFLNAQVSSLGNAYAHHDIKVILYPKDNQINVTDTITVPQNMLPVFHFILHKGLNPSSTTPGVSISSEKKMPVNQPAESYRVKLPDSINTFVLEYQGKIFHPLESSGKEQARGFKQTPGIVSEDGVYLSGSSYWYPYFDDMLITFDLRIELPHKWNVVSQGERTLFSRNGNGTIVQWKSPEPQDEIFIVAGDFTEYTKAGGHFAAMVFLRKPDKELADKYLDATLRYIAMYEKLIGTYPYKKFALVENFWETGFGMPSFTLLGPKVIRFPFIINSSYPHEILHNWWGNSVFPDYAKGNWSEGLTAYLSDHLIKEQQGNGSEYRQTTLQKYADYVLSERDFPLSEFVSRHSSSSEAVGYGKSLMFFHMLRQELGDKIFISGLRDFYRTYRFRFASFDNLRNSFEKVSGKNIVKIFDQWVSRPGAPELKLENVKTASEGNNFILTAGIEQVQDGSPYLLRIPVAITMEGQENAYQTVLAIDRKHAEMKLTLPSRPLRVDIDPEFDLFRRLDRNEIPPAISQALGARKMLVILPSSADENILSAYRILAKALALSGPNLVDVKLDKELKELPSDCAVTILGRENNFFKEIKTALSEYDAKLDQDAIKIEKTKVPHKNHSIVITARNPKNRNMAILWIASDAVDALDGLSRKLPHYNKYSYLVFEGNEPENIAKGRWPVLNSPMTVFIPDERGSIKKAEIGKLALREPLINPTPEFNADKMLDIIRFLSDDRLAGRGFGTEGLDKAAEFIAAKFQEAGLRPGGDEEGSYFQLWKDPEKKVTLKNVIGIIPGKRKEFSGQSVVIGAHYDHLGLGWPDVKEGNKGKIHPGADDNASGIAVLIQLAESLSKLAPDRSIVFVAFTGEEAGKTGSKFFVKNYTRFPVEKCTGMLNLDTVGRLGKGKLLVIGGNSAKEWVHIFRGAGFATGVETEMVSEELDSSDQTSFHEAGVPAVQLFTGAHPDYHRPSDTVDKIDPDGLVKVASVSKEVVEYLSKREEPLSVTLKSGQKSESPVKARKVSLGIIPDFSYTGKGYRISGVVPGSPAEKAGLKEGDIITGINSVPVNSLKDISNILKSLNPGDQISIIFSRDGKETTAGSEVSER